jgi:hypothetical protein
MNIPVDPNVTVHLRTNVHYFQYDCSENGAFLCYVSLRFSRAAKLASSLGSDLDSPGDRGTYSTVFESQQTGDSTSTRCCHSQAKVIVARDNTH